MVLPMVVLPKIAAHWLFSFFKPARKLTRTHSRSSSSSSSSLQYQLITKCPLEGRRSHESLLCDFNGTLLRSPSLFPFFMLVAFEAGSLLRALLLLLSYPLLCLLGGPTSDVSVRIMVFVTFCGLRTRDMATVAKAVLPKFYLEGLNRYSCEVVGSVERRVVVTRMPRVMVEGFLREYLKVGEVVGAELQVLGGWVFSGVMSRVEKHKAVREIFGEVKADVGLVSCFNPHDHVFIPYCKEIYVITKETSGPTSALPRSKYPKPLIFHDGRLAFLPTPSATLFLFLYLPFGLTLALTRILIGTLLPPPLAILLGPFTGFQIRVQNPPSPSNNNSGVLYVCNHRTLLDPLILTAALKKRTVTALTYSLSPLSELLAPIRTVRLTRDRATDARKIRDLLTEGDLVVCPEGTTCREPYLLRFSALFAELAEEMEPVAVETRVGMFYGTTASGWKWLDPVVFLMNPRPEYDVRFLGRVTREMTVVGGGWKGAEVANRIQREIGAALGFECTGLTRKDKYLMLAGNEGNVV